MPSDASIILPMTAATPFLEYVNAVALRTLRYSTDAEVLVLANNTPDPSAYDRLLQLCLSLGFKIEYRSGPYSQSQFWNYGIEHTRGKYIAFANADSIFYPHWLSNMIDLWEEEPDYHALWPWSFHPVGMGLAYRTSLEYERRIQETHHPANVLVLKREDNYRFDESFSLWEMDADLMYYWSAGKHRTGLCLCSRVDHMSSTVSSNIDFTDHFGVDVHEEHASASKALKAKWGLL